MNSCACGKEVTNIINWESFGKNGWGFYCAECYPSVLRILEKHINQMKKEAEDDSNFQKIPTR